MATLQCRFCYFRDRSCAIHDILLLFRNKLATEKFCFRPVKRTTAARDRVHTTPRSGGIVCRRGDVGRAGQIDGHRVTCVRMAKEPKKKKKPERTPILPRYRGLYTQIIYRR